MLGAVDWSLRGRKSSNCLYPPLPLLETIYSTALGSGRESSHWKISPSCWALPYLNPLLGRASVALATTPRRGNVQGGENRMRRTQTLWSNPVPCHCLSQKPAPGHHHRDPSGDSVLHPHECLLLHCDDPDRTPAVPGSGRGECGRGCDLWEKARGDWETDRSGAQRR